MRARPASAPNCTPGPSGQSAWCYPGPTRGPEPLRRSEWRNVAGADCGDSPDQVVERPDSVDSTRTTAPKARAWPPLLGRCRLRRALFDPLSHRSAPPWTGWPTLCRRAAGGGDDTDAPIPAPADVYGRPDDDASTRVQPAPVTVSVLRTLPTTAEGRTGWTRRVGWVFHPEIDLRAFDEQKTAQPASA